MKLLKTFFIGLLLVGWTTACRNDHEALPEPAQASITLTSPGEGDMFLANATVPITGTITSPVSMHGYEITLRNKDTNAVLFTAAGHGHGTTLSFIFGSLGFHDRFSHTRVVKDQAVLSKGNTDL